jgi:hypothetical protein
MSRSSQISNEPRIFNASLYVFQFVVLYFGFAGALMPSVYRHPSWDAGRPDLCNKAMLNSAIQIAIIREGREEVILTFNLLHFYHTQA